MKEVAWGVVRRCYLRNSDSRNDDIVMRQQLRMAMMVAFWGCPAG